MEGIVKKTIFRRAATSMLALIMALSYIPGIGLVYGEDKEVNKKIGEVIEITPEQQEQLKKGEVQLSSEQIMQLDAAEEEQSEGFIDGEAPDVKDVDIEKIPVDKNAAGKEGLRLKGDPGSGDSGDGFQEDSEMFGVFSDPETYPELNFNEAKECEISSGGQIATYQFTPAAAGVYWFYSEGNIDTVGRLVEYDEETSSYRQRTYNDDSEGDSNFRFSFNGTAGKTYYLQARMYDDQDTGSFSVTLYKDSFDPESAKITADTSNNKASHKVKVSGSIEGDTFEDLYIDDMACNAGISGESSFSDVEIDMKDYGVGMHTLYAKLTNHNDSAYWIYYEYGIPTYIYKKPSIKLSEFATTYNHIAYRYSGSSYEGCSVYYDWKKKGGKWNKLVGPVSTSSGTYTREKQKLKAAANYTVRTYFGKVVRYSGASILISGADTGKYSSSKTVKTAGKKLSIKSVKISGVSQKKRKVTGWYIGYVRDPYYGTWNRSLIYGTRNIVTTKFKVTLRLKKKPGTKGIYIGTHKIKGNKKTYTTTFNLEGKYKGKKATFSFNSYQSTKYTSSSPYVRKNIKIK